MPVDETGLTAAIDAGIADAAPAPSPAPESTNAPTDPQPPADDGGSSDEGSTALGGDGGAPAVSTDGDGQAKPGDGVEAPAGDIDGKPDGNAGEGGEETDAAKPTEPVGDQPKDPVNDPLPNAMKRETKERVTSLITMVKEKTAALEEKTAALDDLFGAIERTGATPAQYSQALDYLRMVNTDPEAALEFMQREIAALARMVGKPVPGVNMLEGHQDLIDELATGRITPQRAEEIAAARAARQFAQNRAQAQRNQNQSAEQTQRAVAQGRQALNELGAALKGRDGPVYEQKRKLLVESLKPVFAQIPPSQWAATFKRAYEALQVPAATPAPVAPRPAAPVVPQNTPLRASNPAGAAQKVASSPLDAINMGIAEAR